jgi:hypothetical protein
VDWKAEWIWDGGEASPRNAWRCSRSHYHAWSAGPLYFSSSLVLGVQPLIPGWTKVAVEPYRR